MTAIRIAEPGDAQLLSSLGAKTFIDTFGELYRPEDLEKFLSDKHSEAFYRRFVEDAENIAWIAESADGAAIGYCLAGPCSLPVDGDGDGAGELHRLYLCRDAQGSGLGRTLAEMAVKWLESRFDPVFVGVFSENTRAQNLYMKCGFEKVAEYHYMVGNQADLEWIMKKSAKTA